MSSVQEKVTRHVKKQKIWPIQRKKIKNKPTDTALEKDQMIENLDKEFRTAVLKMLEELKEDVEKVKNVV